MKTRPILGALALVGVCFAGQADATMYTLSGGMDVTQATTNPDNVGDGTGSIAGTYDDETMFLSYTIEWENLTSEITNMHFHVGAPGVPGGVDLGIPGPWSSPHSGTDIELTEDQESNLLAGDWYVNIHTDDFGGGEIRGQVLVEVVPEPATSLLLGLGALGAVMRRRVA